MAAALRAALATRGMVEDVMAVGSGVVDGFLLEKVPVAFLIKNIGIPVLSLFVREIPDALKKESEGMLGLAIYALITRGVKLA
jgi:hypothetical protein